MTTRDELVARARHAGFSCLIVSTIPALLVALAIGFGLRQVGMRALAAGGGLWLTGLVSLAIVLIVGTPRSVRAGFFIAASMVVALAVFATVGGSACALGGPIALLGLALIPLHRLARDLERVSERLPTARVR